MEIPKAIELNATGVWREIMTQGFEIELQTAFCRTVYRVAATSATGGYGTDTDDVCGRVIGKRIEKAVHDPDTGGEINCQKPHGNVVRDCSAIFGE